MFVLQSMYSICVYSIICVHNPSTCCTPYNIRLYWFSISFYSVDCLYSVNSISLYSICIVFVLIYIVLYSVCFYSVIILWYVRIKLNICILWKLIQLLAHEMHVLTLLNSCWQKLIALWSIIFDTTSRKREVCSIFITKRRRLINLHHLKKVNLESTPIGCYTDKK